MKILLIANGLRSGGKERQVTELVKGLMDNPSLQILLLIMNEEIFYHDIYKTGVKIKILPQKLHTTYRNIYKIYTVCKEFKPDIVHSWDYMSSFYVLPSILLLKIKFVNGAIRFANIKFPFFSKLWFMNKVIFRYADKIVANSKAGLVSLNLEYKGTVIFNGFDNQRINNLTNPEIIRSKFKLDKAIIIGMVAKFKLDKDYETLVNAALNLLKKYDHLLFVLVGDGQKFEKIQQLVKNEINIKLLGEQQNIESIINVFDICVLSTFSEGISNSIMEYMALGKPVVATDGGGTNEIVVDGETGYLVNPTNPAQMASKIELLINDIELRRSMGQKGKKRILNEFSLSQMIQSYFQLYEDLVKN